MKELFIKTEGQRQWLSNLGKIEDFIKNKSQQLDEEGTFPHEQIGKLREIGFTKLSLPKEFGGEGLNLDEILLLQETLASFDGSTALVTSWTLLTVGELFENRHWNPQKLAFLGDEVKNGAIINRAVSEIVTGSPTRGGRPETTAKRNGTEWIINGRKSYTTGSLELDYFLTAAWLEEEETVGHFLIHKQTKGVSIEENWHVMSMRGSGSHDLILENVRLEQSDLVERLSNATGTKVNGWILLIPATYLGIAQAASDYALTFANTHSPNSISGTIATLPNVQSLLGEIEAELMKARYTLYGAAQSYIEFKEKEKNGVQFTEEEASSVLHAINVAKYTVTNSAIVVVDKAMRLVGAKSLQQSNPLQRYYRDVRAGLHNPPMDDLTLKKIAESALMKNKRNL